MIIKYISMLSLVCLVIIISGCSVLLSEQEWSENYALLDGAKATSMQMIDGDMNTVGETSSQKGTSSRVGSSSAPEIIVSLPAKKIVRKIVIHTDNIKNFVIYADKGGSALSGSDWQMIKQVQSVKSNPIVIPVLYSFPTDRIRLSVLGTTDDAALTRKENADGIRSVAGIADCATGST